MKTDATKATRAAKNYAKRMWRGGIRVWDTGSAYSEADFLAGVAWATKKSKGRGK